MTHTISGSYATLVSLATGSGAPPTITGAARLNAGPAV
jgi:hypothetical protein